MIFGLSSHISSKSTFKHLQIPKHEDLLTLTLYLSYTGINDLGVGPLVRHNKQFENIKLGSENLWWTFNNNQHLSIMKIIVRCSPEWYIWNDVQIYKFYATNLNILRKKVFKDTQTNSFLCNVPSPPIQVWETLEIENINE